MWEYIPWISLLLLVIPGGCVRSKHTSSLCFPRLNREGFGGIGGFLLCLHTWASLEVFNSPQFLHIELLLSGSLLFKGGQLCDSSVCIWSELSGFVKHWFGTVSVFEISQGICEVEHERERIIRSWLTAWGWNVDKICWWLECELFTLWSSSLFTDSESLCGYSWLDKLFSETARIHNETDITTEMWQ